MKTAIATMGYVQTKNKKYKSYLKVSSELGDPLLEELDTLLADLGTYNCWDAINNFFKRQWWRRVRCVQEIVLAKKALIMCGKEEVDWNMIYIFSTWYAGQRIYKRRLKPKQIDSNNIYAAFYRSIDRHQEDYQSYLYKVLAR